MTTAAANSTTTGTLPANATLRVLGNSIVTITRNGAVIAAQSTDRDNFVGPYPTDTSYSVVAGGASVGISLVGGDSPPASYRDPATGTYYVWDAATGAYVGVGGSSGVVQATHAPSLKHFFAADRLSAGGGLVDVVGGLTFTPAVAVLSVVSPEFITVAAAASGALTLSNPFAITGAKPFLVMAVYSLNATGIGLAGFHFTGQSSASIGQLELWGISASSNSLVGIGTLAVSETNTLYADGAGRTDIAVGMLVVPGVSVDFIYAGPAGYWESTNEAWLAGVPAVLPPIDTICDAISNTTNGVRKIYGFIVYEFDSKPTDWKAAVIDMRTNWLAGKKTPYSGW